MKEKIQYFDELSKKYNKISETIKEKEQEVLGNNKRIVIQSSVDQLKVT
jgi:hypothetical protein